jgi:hypothetical protein
MESRRMNRSPHVGSSLWRVCFIILVALTANACSSLTDSADADRNREQPSQSESRPSVERERVSDSTPSASGPVPDAAPRSAGAYISLTDYQASKQLYAASKVVLFFNAKWCSTCKKARSNLEADLSAIPSDLAIVLVDFDSETALKRQYGVTVQHTFVQIDGNGKALAKWSGSLTAQQIVENTV